MDTLALGTGILGVMIGASLCYWVVKRRWWKAAGGSAIGSVLMLNLVTSGVHSHLENRVKFAATVILVACFLATLVADARTRRSLPN